MTNTPKRAADAAIRSNPRLNWPKGLLGWLAYLIDHRFRGFTRPVDWLSLRAIENGGHGVPICANGTVLGLLGYEIDVFRLIAKGELDVAIADTVRLTPQKIARLRAKLMTTFGASDWTDLAHIAATHGIQ